MVLDLYNNDTDQFLHVPTATQTSNYQYCEDYQYFYRLYDAAMLSITSYTKVGLRLATFIGMTVGCISLVVAIIYLILKLLFWDNFPAGMAPLLIVTCLLGSIQLFFIGLIGEYIMSINDRVKKRPLVVEDERLNFLDEKEKENEADDKEAEDGCKNQEAE